jgi:hypothetical protein
MRKSFVIVIRLEMDCEARGSGLSPEEVIVQDEQERTLLTRK